MKNLHITKLKVVVLFFLVLGTITTVKAQETEMPNGEQILKYSWIAVDLNTCEPWSEGGYDLINMSLTASWMQDFTNNFAGGLTSGLIMQYGSADIPLGGDLRYNMFTKMKVNPFVGVKGGILIGTRGDFAIDTFVIWSAGVRVKQKFLIGLDVNFWRMRDIKQGFEDPYAALRLGWEF